LLVLLKAGAPPSMTVGEPGTHGAGVLGRHAAGVKTPSFAAVAAATIGFAIELQSGNGMMFTSGT